MKINFGNTAQHRKDFIKNIFDFNNSIIDIGCGDGFYAIQFAKLLDKNNKKLQYFAVDLDENELQEFNLKLKEKALEMGCDNNRSNRTYG